MGSSVLAPRAFRDVYREHYGFVWATVRRFGVPNALVDDALQDTFVVAYRRRDELRATSARPWLYGIARRIASNYRRSARRLARKRRAVAHASSPASSRPQEPHGVLHDLDRFLGELPDRDRELFVLSEVEGLTGPELAAALGCKMSTAYGRVRTLRQRFAQHGGNGGLERARTQRPRASAKSWAAFVHAIGGARSGLGLGAIASTGAAMGVGALVAAAVVAGVIAVRTPSASAVADDRSLATPAAPASSSVPAEPSPSSATATAATEASTTASVLATSSPPIAPTGPDPVRTPRAADRAAAEAEVDPLAQENALLREASGALAAGAPERALASMQRHAARFPDSALSDLRVALRVEALCALGKGAQARGEARAYVAAHPASPAVERIRSACPADSQRSGHSTN